MKIRVSLKDPDSMPDAVSDAVYAEVKRQTAGLSDEERRELANARKCGVQSEITKRWMPYSEYLLVEFDTETWEARVLPAKNHR